MRKFALTLIIVLAIPIYAQNENDILEDAVSAYNNNDFKNAFELFLQASKMNNGYGYLFLGWCYEQGKGTLINPDSALTCYKKAALLKNEESCYRLGLLYINGLGVKQSEKRALAWYKKGQIREEDAYQRAYDLASGKVKEFTLKDLSIPNAENVLSYEVLERLYCSIKGDTEFDEEEQDDNGFKEHNMCFLAICYEKGLGGCSNINYERAVYWYEKAQQNPNAPEMSYILCRLGYLYHKGLGVKKDNSKSVNWLEKAALLNDPKAIVMLGWMYEKGYGVKKNTQYANELFSKAQNIEKDQMCFEQVMSFRSIKNLFSGDGCIEDNIEKALYWEELAEDKGTAFPKDSIPTRSFNKPKNISSQKQRFIALVIGNDDYENGRLENPVRDAKALKDEFENMGITTVMRLNGNQQEVEEDVAKFAEQAKDYDAALFYFSGHALQLDGENYLFPVGENLPSRSAVKYKCVSLSSVIENLLDSGVKNNVLSCNFYTCPRGRICGYIS